MSERRGRPWPTPARLELARVKQARYCVNCWWRTVDHPGDGLCSVCRPLYEAALARAASLDPELELEEVAPAPAPEPAVELEAAAPTPLVHPVDCDCDRCEDLRRRALRRAGIRIPGLAPKNEWGEPEL